MRTLEQNPDLPEGVHVVHVVEEPVRFVAPFGKARELGLLAALASEEVPEVGDHIELGEN